MELEIGTVIEGKITGITKFGVFVGLPGNKTGLVHISEVSQNYVENIEDHVKEGDTVKVKVLTVSDAGKISLSIKKAIENTAGAEPRKPRPAPAGNRQLGAVRQKPDGGNENSAFENMMSKFKQSSDEKISTLKRKNPDSMRTKGRNN